MNSEIRIKVANYTLSFRFNNKQTQVLFYLKDFYKNYLTTQNPNLIINFISVKQINIPSSNLYLYKTKTWDLYKNKNDIFLYFHFNKRTPPSLCKINLISKDIKFYIQKGFLPHPLFYVFPKFLFGLFIFTKNVLLFHSCGIADGSKGYLFLGDSGRGKTTLCYIAKKYGFKIINDDAVALVKEEDRYKIYPTPWFGDFKEEKVCTKNGYIIHNIFFLRQSKYNKIIPADKESIYKEVIRNLFFLRLERKNIGNIYKYLFDLYSQLNFYYFLFNLNINLKEVLNDFSKRYFC